MSSIAFGCVRINRSLLPLRSRWKCLNRAPRNAASSYCSPWIMVPMAPSSTRMRSRARARSAVRLGETGTFMGSCGFLGAIGPNAQQMADGEHEIGAVHGVEVKGVDAVLGEFLHLAGGDGGRHQLAGFRIVVEAFEFLRKPVRYGGAGASDKIAGLFEIVHRHDAGHDRNRDAARTNPVEIAEIQVVVEEDLGDGAGRAGVDLGLEDIDVGIEVAALGVLLWIGGDGNFDVGMLPLDTGNEIRRTAITIRMRGVGGADAARRIAAKCYDMTDADIVIAADDLVDLAARRADAGQMRGRQQVSLSKDARDGGMGALPRGPAGAIGHRDEIGSQRRKTLDGFPQAALHFLGFRREELEGDRGAF